MMLHMTEDQATAFGEAIKQARGGRSVRAMAVRAGMSEGRWRQLEKGYQQVGQGQKIPARPRVNTVMAMARAVGMDVTEALHLAGFEEETESDENYVARTRPGYAFRPLRPPADLTDNELRTVTRELASVDLDSLPRSVASVVQSALDDYLEEYARRLAASGTDGAE